MTDIQVRRLQHLAVFTAAVAAIVMRGTTFLQAPRLWAEEGPIYFQYAMTHPWWDALLKPHLGYYSLVSNLATVIAAKAVPLALAAHITTYTGLAIQLATVMLVWRGPHQIVKTPVERAVLAFGLLILVSTEVWLNALTMQFWLAAGTLYLLGQERITRAGYAYLVVALLTGVTSLFLMPFFFLRAWRERSSALNKSSPLYKLCAFSLLVLAGQVYAMLACDDCVPHARFAAANLNNLPGAVFETAVMPMFSLPLFRYNFTLSACLFVATIASAIWLCLRNRALLMVAVPTLFYGVMCIAASLDMIGPERYSLPLELGLLIMLIALGQQLNGKWPSILPAVLLLIAHLPSYFSIDDHYQPSWPNWQAQAAAVCQNGQDQNGQQRIINHPAGPDDHWFIDVPDSYCPSGSTERDNAH